MIYITGDTHRNFKRLDYLNKGDTLIILGDAGINYYLDINDMILKDQLNKRDIKLFCIRGNHEERPENISTYKESMAFDGNVMMEETFSNLLFAKDGETYNIDDKKILVIGGAYSIDKKYRIMHHYHWFKDEQLSIDEMNRIYDKVNGNHYDVILTHTCPKKYEPIEVFLRGIDQSLVDKNMEEFLDEVEKAVTYDKWYCGHFHTDKQVNNIRFMFKDIEEFSSGKLLTKVR